MIKYFSLALCFTIYPHSTLISTAVAIEISSQIETSGRNKTAIDTSLADKVKNEPNKVMSGMAPSQSKLKPNSEKTKVRRNQIVNIEYSTGQLKIIVSARALKSGMSGETINLLNTSSRSTLYGIVNEDGGITLKSKEQ